jgi:hypothetical protein
MKDIKRDNFTMLLAQIIAATVSIKAELVRVKETFLISFDIFLCFSTISDFSSRFAARFFFCVKQKLFFFTPRKWFHRANTERRKNDTPSSTEKKNH